VIDPNGDTMAKEKSQFSTKIKGVKKDFSSVVTLQERLTDASLTSVDIGNTSKSSSMRVVREEVIDGKRFKVLTVG